MEVYRRSSWLLLLLGITFLAAALQGVQGEAESEGPSESECRPYIEKALKELATEDVAEHPDASGGEDSAEDVPTIEVTTDDPDHPEDGDGDDDPNDDGKESAESVEHDNETTNDQSAEENDKSKEGDNASAEQTGEDASAENETKSEEQTENEDNKENDSVENAQIVEDMASKGDDDVESHADIKNDNESVEDDTKSKEDDENSADDTKSAEDDNKSGENDDKSTEDTESADDENESAKSAEDDGKSTEDNDKSAEDGGSNAEGDGKSVEDDGKSVEDDGKSSEDDGKSAEDDGKGAEDDGKSVEDDTKSAEDDPESTERNTRSTEDDDKSTETEPVDTKSAEDDNKSNDDNTKSEESDAKSAEDKTGSAGDETTSGENDANSKQDEANSVENEDNKEATKQDTPKESPKQADAKSDEENESGNEVSKEDKTESDEVSGEDKSDEPVPEEELTKEIDIPTELRPRDHIEQLLKLDDEHLETEKIINRVAEITLRELKRLYENAIKPLEVLYKYRDLSNRHFGDPEIFAKPLVLFMGPWSGGKSSIINYLLDNEYNDTSLRTGAEPSPAYFNILMHGEEAEILEGTQLAADYTFSGLQKFGQGLEERLRGLKLPTKLLEKINIVEIPGILEVRKQVSRLFPFNDACQWFIDRADIIFLVYDPSKLDVGPETEAILDQLKGREHQTRIILNKADQVKPEELMRVQGALIWNISPLMSSAQPPIMYTTSLWSRPYEAWAPVRLLQAQERAFLRDLRSAIDKRIENKIASARRFAVRVRNHAKMVDCYLTTYYNHKSVFGNKKQVADEITEHPQDYHIYEGISTLTNISRYDLPDPDVYRDFFKLNPLYDFQQLSATCTYFRGCPINRLDVAIAYDLPELVGKHRRLVENALAEANLSQTPDS